MPRLLHPHQTSRYPVEQGAELDSEPILYDVVKLKIRCTTRQSTPDSPVAQTQYRLSFPDNMRKNKPIRKQSLKAGQPNTYNTQQGLYSVFGKPLSAVTKISRFTTLLVYKQLFHGAPRSKKLSFIKQLGPQTN
jgi:hypothetical protein